MYKKILHLALACIIVFTSSVANAATISETNTYNSEQQLNIKNSFKSICSLPRRFKNKIKIVFSDIDGTLLPLDKSQSKRFIPNSVKKGAAKLKRAGVVLVFATGRSYQDAKKIVKKITSRKTYIVAHQGAVVYDPNGKLIVEKSISAKDTKKILNEISYFNKKREQDSKAWFYVEDKAYALEKFSPPYITDEIIVLEDINSIGKDFKTVKIGIYESDPQKLQALQTYLKKEYSEYQVNISSDCTCDISAKDANKGDAVKEVAKILDVDLKNTAVLGDSENDVAMFKEVKTNQGLTIAVDNAMESVKEYADFVTLPVSKDGFEKAVEEIVQVNAVGKENCFLFGKLLKYEYKIRL